MTSWRDTPAETRTSSQTERGMSPTGAASSAGSILRVLGGMAFPNRCFSALGSMPSRLAASTSQFNRWGCLISCSALGPGRLFAQVPRTPPDAAGPPSAFRPSTFHPSAFRPSTFHPSAFHPSAPSEGPRLPSLRTLGAASGLAPTKPWTETSLCKIWRVERYDHGVRSS